MKASDIQIGGDHYKNFDPQPFEWFLKNKIPFHKADIIKRILRYDHASGKGKKDLQKIKHEVDLILEFDPLFKKIKPKELDEMWRNSKSNYGKEPIQKEE